MSNRIIEQFLALDCFRLGAYGSPYVDRIMLWYLASADSYLDSSFLKQVRFIDTVSPLPSVDEADYNTSPRLCLRRFYSGFGLKELLLTTISTSVLLVCYEEGIHGTTEVKCKPCPFASETELALTDLNLKI